MRISKIIVALLVSVVAVTAMTGVAVANPAELTIMDDPIINPLDGTTVTDSDVKVYSISWASMGNNHVRHISVQTSTANLKARVYGQGADTGWTTGDEAAGRVGANWTATKSDDEPFWFTVEVNGTETGLVTVHDNNGTAYSVLSADDKAEATREVLVPEFATIAIPAIAVLGLFLFFNKRKHKKD